MADSAPMANLGHIGELVPKQLWDGVAARVVAGERATLIVVELDPGAVVAEHSHPNEQLGVVVEGSLTFTAGDETQELGPGGTWRLLGGTPHRVVAGDG